jgi:signal transduction histidine kinase
MLCIKDDGHGFDVAAARGRGVGLSSMSERLAALGGTLEIHSAIGQGTEVLARCPLGAAAAR